MSDTTQQAPPAPPAPSEAAPPAPAAGPTLAPEDIQAIAAALKAQMDPNVPSGPTPTSEAPPSPENLFSKGQVVRYDWDDHYDGPSSRYGIVVDTLPDEGAGARSVVAWFDSVSGPIGDHVLAEG